MSEPLPPSVLVADDDDFVRDVLVRHLTRDGYRVEAAIDGENALAMIESEDSFDLVITDLHMPGANGIEVLRAAKKKWPSIAVFIMSAFSDAATSAEAKEAGAIAFLEKPFSYTGAIAEKLRGAIRKG